MEIPFLGGAYEGRSKSINAQMSVNLFPVYDRDEGKTVVAMYGTPGNTTFSSPATAAIVRGLHIMGAYVYAVVGAVVYEIASNGTATNLGSLTTSTGHVGMADNGTQLLIVDGTTSGKIVTTGSMAAIVDADFPASTDCVFFDGYFVVSIANTGRIAISDLYDGLVWDALDFDTAESSPDNLVGLGVTKQNIWLIGALSCEVYYNSGNADFPFERVPGAILDIGCASLSSIAEVDGRVYWLTNKNSVVRSEGYAHVVVSKPGIDYQISTYTTQSNAIGFTYTLEGRTFYALNFPTHDKTWVVDIGTGAWHEWQSLDAEDSPEQFRGVAGTTNGVLYNGKALIGDRTTGKIFQLSMNTYTDNAKNIKRIRRAQIINKERFNVIHSMVEIEFEAGVGLNVGAEADGYDPQAILKWSDDGGRSWSSGRSVSIGKYEEYTARAKYRGLGKSRNRIYELTIEEPVKVVIIGAYSRLQACGA